MTNNNLKTKDMTPSQQMNKEWKAIEEDSHRTACVIDETGRNVCDVYGDGYKTRNERARLIAAAPELAEALQAVLKADANPRPWEEPRYSDAIVKVRNALAKAGAVVLM